MSQLATRALILSAALMLSLSLPAAFAASALPATTSSGSSARSPEGRAGEPAVPTRVLHSALARRGDPADIAEIDPAPGADAPVPTTAEVPVAILDALVIERAVPDDVVPDLPDVSVGFEP